MKIEKHRLAALCLGISISLLLGACSLQKEGTSTVNPGQVQEISVALLEPSSQEPTSWEKIPERFPVQK